MMIFYISGMTDDERGGIFRCQYDKEPQVLEFTQLERNSFLAWGKDRRVIYATMQHDGQGGVAAYRVKSNGELEHLNTVPANGASACYLEVSPDARYLYSANYRSGNFSEFLLNEDGSINKLLRTFAHTGSSVRPEQDSTHPHCCTFTPDGKYLCVADLGIDKVVLYAYDAENGIADTPSDEIILPPGSGPRHIIFDGKGKVAYLICELNCTANSYRYENGKLVFQQCVTTLPANKDSGSAAALRFSGDGSKLFASTRKSDNIAVFTLDGEGGMEPCGMYASGGSSPRDFNFLCNGRIAAVANEFSGETVFFDCDADSGNIGSQTGTLTLPRPLYVLI